MTEADVANFVYQASNVLASAGLASCAIAVAIGLYEKAAQYKWLAALFVPLLGAASVEHFLAIFTTKVPSPLELIANTILGISAFIAGIVVWFVLRRALEMPSYDEIKTNNKELNYYKSIFQSFMENSPAISLIKGLDSKILYVNRSYIDTFGISSSEVIGKVALPGIKKDLEDFAIRHDRRVLEVKHPVSEIYELNTRYGLGQWLMVKFPILEGATGEIGAIGTIGVNIDEQFKTERLREELSAIVDSTQDAIIGKDLEGRINTWNNGAEELYGYSAEEAIGQPISMLCPPERVHEVAEILDKTRRGIRIQNYETVRVSKQGDRKDVSLSVAPVRDRHGTIIAAAVLARDITALKRKEEEVNELNKQLKNRVYELAEMNAALQAARDQALEASNLKSAFAANISHELRTPLSGILGLNEMILLDEKLDPQTREFAQIVQQSAEALLVVVNDILDLTKIEAGKVTLEYTEFEPILLLKDCTRLMAVTAKNKNLEYEMNADPNLPEVVFGDESRLRQVLLNLIGNAIKFTSTGRVIVTAKVTEANVDTAKIEFSVEDTGIGIAPEDRRFLFMPFAQVDNKTTRRFGGTGLGLTITKRFVDLMGGNITVESTIGVGSKFTVQIPFDLRSMHVPQEFTTQSIMKPAVPPVPSELAIGRRILIVEDNAVLQQLILRQMASLGLDAETTTSGKQAVELAKTDRFDVVLMDINLPDITGLEATAAIREFERLSKRPMIPIIALTAGAMKGDRERALTSGMNDYLAKPVSIEKLKSTLENWLERSEVRQYFHPSPESSPDTSDRRSK